MSEGVGVGGWREIGGGTGNVESEELKSKWKSHERVRESENEREKRES